MSQCQVLILIALAKAGRPLQVCELTEKTNEIRQNIYKDIEIMDGDLVDVRRPSRVNTFVDIRQEGIDALSEMMGMERKK